MNWQTAKAPLHLWIVGVLAVLWNAIGAFDYSATQLRLQLPPATEAKILSGNARRLFRI